MVQTMISQSSHALSGLKLNNNNPYNSNIIGSTKMAFSRGIQKDTVSFTAKAFNLSNDMIKEAITNKVSKLGDGTAVEFFYAPNNKDQGKQSVYDLNTKTLKVNTANIKAQSHLDAVLEKTCFLALMASLYGDDIKGFTETFAKEYGIEEPFIPSLELSVVNDLGSKGMYTLCDNKININVESFVQSDYILPMIISHEMSHCRSFMDFSLIKPEDIPECCRSGKKQNAFFKAISISDSFKEYRNYRQSHNPVESNSPEYKRILHNYKQFLDDIEHNKDSDQYEEALARTNSAITCKKHIKNPCYSLIACINDEIGKIKSLVFRKDQDVRELIRSGKVQLDRKTLEHVRNDKSNYMLDLSKQEG